MPAAKRKRSKAMCVAVPNPASAQTILRGFARAAPTNSAMVRYFSGCVTRTTGRVATMATGRSSSGLTPAGCRRPTVQPEVTIMITWPSAGESAT